MISVSRLRAAVLRPPALRLAAAARAFCSSDAASKLSPHVKAMELALVYNPQDFARAATEPWPRVLGAEDLTRGYAFSGSTAGRNIDLIYQKAEAAGANPSLQGAVEACLGPSRVKHVLLCSGFHVLHSKGGTATGSCETDGPLGVLALLRAFALRGVQVSLFCETRNGPVIQAGYEAMLEYFQTSGGPTASLLEANSRCLPFVTDVALNPERRAEFVASQVSEAVKESWGDAVNGPIDCLFALERLGAPYRNIRGRDLSEHTEPVDTLWPAVQANAGLAAESAKRVTSWAADDPTASEAAMRKLRGLAGVREDALSLGIGDGGNEVGMGKVAHLEGLAELSPGGDASYVSLAENGCYRTCDHLILSTVSNWAGSAFEAAANVLYEAEVDYVGDLKAKGARMSDVEAHILAAIMAPPAKSVDGIDPDRVFSVDGMPFEPNHRDLYDTLWKLSEAGARANADKAAAS